MSLMHAHVTTCAQSDWIVLCCLQCSCKELMPQLVECMDSSLYMHRQTSIGLHAMKGALGSVGHFGQLPPRFQISPCPLPSAGLTVA